MSKQAVWAPAALLFFVIGCGGAIEARSTGKGLASNAPGSPGSPCTTGTPTCHGEFPINRRFAPYYATYPLSAVNTDVTSAIVVIHGNGRDANVYFETMVNAANAAGVLGTTLILAPHFQSNRGSCTDTPAQDELVWGCEAWKEGGAAINPGPGNTVYSFDVVDFLLAALADPNGSFPSLNRILVVGHSAGAQFLQRYASGTPSDLNIPIPIKYVVSDASSYMYLTNERLDNGATCAIDGTCTGSFVPYYDAVNCAGYDTFRYGLVDRTAYLAQVSDGDLQTQYAARNVVYLSGDLDDLAHAMGTTMDRSCQANAQGIDRHTRSINFFSYMLQNRGAAHTFVNVAGCPHSAPCIFSAPEARSVLFQ